MATLRDEVRRVAVVAASAPPYGAGGVASAHFNVWRALTRVGVTAKLFTFYDNGVPKKSEKNIVRSGVAPQWVKRLFILLHLPWRVMQPGKLSYQTAEILRNMPGAIRMARKISAYSPSTVLLSDHGAPGLWLKKQPGQRFVLVSHHNPARISAESGLGEFSVADTRVAIGLENLVLKKIDHVICPSHYMRRWFKKTYRYTGPVTVVPNLIDLSTVDGVAPAALKTKLKLAPQARLVYLPSAGSRIKGAAYLLPIIDALLATSRVALGFYIPGEIEPDVAQALDKHPARRHMWLPGHVRYNQHIALVKACDVAISPALMENFSMAIVEAAYLGVPVVAFRRGGNADIIQDGQNGYLIPKRDTKAVAARASALLNSSDLLAIKKNTKTFTRQNFDADVVLAGYLQAMLPEVKGG